jgi:hypothetical protein
MIGGNAPRVIRARSRRCHGAGTHPHKIAPLSRNVLPYCLESASVYLADSCTEDKIINHFSPATGAALFIHFCC